MALVESLSAAGQHSGIFAFMNTQWGWPFIESLHFTGLTLLLGSIGLIDLRLIGFGRGIPVIAMHGLVRLGIAGFVLNVMTGALFVVSDPGQYVYNPAFQIKVVAICVAGINAAVFHLLFFRQILMLPAHHSLPLPARLAGLLSLTCWSVAIAGGRLITFYRPPEFWCAWC